ncbi:MAG: hypothetical protein FJZ58_06115 [Chlamydiae bacterium]|nr:hypothetical protein [Chlamydiota bacterium]
MSVERPASGDICQKAYEQFTQSIGRDYSKEVWSKAWKGGTSHEALNYWKTVMQMGRDRIEDLRQGVVLSIGESCQVAHCMDQLNKLEMVASRTKSLAQRILLAKQPELTLIHTGKVFEELAHVVSFLKEKRLLQQEKKRALENSVLVEGCGKAAVQAQQEPSSFRKKFPEHLRKEFQHQEAEQIATWYEDKPWQGVESLQDHLPDDQIERLSEDIEHLRRSSVEEVTTASSTVLEDLGQLVIGLAYEGWDQVRGWAWRTLVLGQTAEEVKQGALVAEKERCKELLNHVELRIKTIGTHKWRIEHGNQRQKDLLVDLEKEKKQILARMASLDSTKK